MKRISTDQLSREELIGLIDRLFDAFGESERRNSELLKRLEDQARRIDEQPSVP